MCIRWECLLVFPCIYDSFNDHDPNDLCVWVQYSNNVVIEDQVHLHHSDNQPQHQHYTIERVVSVVDELTIVVSVIECVFIIVCKSNDYSQYFGLRNRNSIHHEVPDTQQVSFRHVKCFGQLLGEPDFLYIVVDDIICVSVPVAVANKVADELSVCISYPDPVTLGCEVR